MAKLNLDFEIVEIEPFSEDFNFKTIRKDVFVYGSVKLAKISTKYNWSPGSFYGGNHDFEVYSKKYQNNLLNYESLICKFSDNLNWKPGEEKFIRPSKDAKLFTGKKFTQTKWNDFVNQSLQNKQNTQINEQTLIQITEPKKIFKEARVWIIGGKVITSSYYLFHGNMDYEENVESEGLSFAQSMANLYQVADAFVMDVCLTSDGWKIVEINCINSAGFYKGDVLKIISALERKFN